MASGVLTSKGIVGKFNIPYSTVTHYTDMGFFTVVSRKGNKRMYDEEEIAMQLIEITKLTKEGYPLRLIRKILAEKKGGLLK